MQATRESESIASQYTALVESVALAESEERAIIAGSGQRPAAMLSGLVTNDLAPLDAGRAVYALALTPKARPIADMRIVPADTLWLDTPAACVGQLLEHLAKYVPPRFASFDRSSDVARLSLVGPSAGEAVHLALRALGWARAEEGPASPLEPLEVVRWTDETSGSTVFVVGREKIEGPGQDLYIPRSILPPAQEALEKAVRRAGGTVASAAACDIWRVERGVPAFGLDFGPDNLPQETGLEDRAISYEKGCYTGQEVVARIHYRGHVNRRLCGLSLTSHSTLAEATPAAMPDAAGAPLEFGAGLYRGDRSVGRITTSVRSPRFGPIALGYVRHEIEPGESLSLEPDGNARVRVHALPFTST
jgi:folate-binding protein YgfZ